mmetsp:Transcript_23841/g.53792  ORF Transcript_23841/g.53792 Transcript_23841/m.53792 type:complete len:226 (+) Transcript_23841:506-1183(+)
MRRSDQVQVRPGQQALRVARREGQRGRGRGLRRDQNERLPKAQPGHAQTLPAGLRRRCCPVPYPTRGRHGDGPPFHAGHHCRHPQSPKQLDFETRQRRRHAQGGGRRQHSAGDSGRVWRPAGFGGLGRVARGHAEPRRPSPQRGARHKRVLPGRGPHRRQVQGSTLGHMPARQVFSEEKGGESRRRPEQGGLYRPRQRNTCRERQWRADAVGQGLDRGVRPGGRG